MKNLKLIHSTKKSTRMKIIVSHNFFRLNTIYQIALSRHNFKKYIIKAVKKLDNLRDTASMILILIYVV